ncbi:unnamed protein product, partial [marine sediment metagenome]
MFKSNSDSELSRFEKCELEAAKINSFFSILAERQVVVTMFKMPFKTKHFNKGQKVWIQYLSGAMSAKVIGRYRKKFR